MIKTIGITKLIRNPEEIRKFVSRGFTLKVLFNNKHVFDISPPKKEEGKQERIDDLPSFELDLPDNISKKEIYEDYGQRK